MAQHFALRLQRPTFKSVVKQVIKSQIVFRNESLFRVMMREELRRVIREENRVFLDAVEHRIQGFLLQLGRPQSIPMEITTSETPLKLQFIKALAERVYLGDPVKSEDGSTLSVELVNGQRRVTCGPLSRAQVQIVALKGDFAKEDWETNGFSDNILNPVNGKAPLLVGDTYVTLKEGLGVVDNVVFKDISSRYGGEKFRIGARFVSDQRTSLAVNIKEAKSNAFTVNCSRLKEYKKHHPPNLDSEVWRLKHIGKNGCFHKGLCDHGINSVKDFLRMHITQPSILYNIVKQSGRITERTWKEITSHALQCDLHLDDEFYVYRTDSSGLSLLLNSVYSVVAVSFHGQGILSLDQLDSFQQEKMEQLKCQAYKDLSKLVRLDHRTLPSLSSLLPTSGDALQVSSSHQVNQGPLRSLPTFEDISQFTNLHHIDQGELNVFKHTFPLTPDQFFTSFIHQGEFCASQTGTNEPVSSSRVLSEHIDSLMPQSNSLASNTFENENILQDLEFSSLNNFNNLL